MNPVLDLLFPVVGTWLPIDHGYLLYAALSRLLPSLHDGSIPFALSPVTGRAVGEARLALDGRESRLRLRLPVDKVPHVLPLAGKTISVMGRRITLGVPVVQALKPVPSLFARTVTISKCVRASNRAMSSEASYAASPSPRVSRNRTIGNSSSGKLYIRDCRVCGRNPLPISASPAPVR